MHRLIYWSRKAGGGSGMLKRIFMALVGAFRWLIDLLFGTLRRLIGFAFLTIIVGAVIVSAWYFAEYRQYAYKFSPSTECQLQNRIVKVQLDFVFDCIDAARSRPADNAWHHFVLLMANEDDPNLERSGHGWLVLARMRLEGERIRVHNWRAVGFWGDGKNTCPPWVK